MKRRLSFIAGAAAICGAALALVIAVFSGRSSSFRFESRECKRTYEQLYQKPLAEFLVVFGYKDARPERFVGDRYERLVFIQRLLAPCVERSGACGFSRDPADADAFTKVITGPDGKPRQVRMRVIGASVGPDDQENRRDPFQKWKSHYASENFVAGLRSVEVVFYNGHSRAGGGPDFDPPLLTKGNEVDFVWYRKREPGLNRILGALEPQVETTRLLGLFSCASSKLFLQKVQERSPRLGVITSPQLIYFADALESSLSALSSILSMQCRSKFEEGLKKAETQPAAEARVSGFF